MGKRKIVKFVQPSCAPCKMVNGFMQHQGLEVDEVIDIVEDMDGMEKADHYGVMRTPTLILLDENNVELDRVSGFDQKKVQELFAMRG